MAFLQAFTLPPLLKPLPILSPLKTPISIFPKLLPTNPRPALSLLVRSSSSPTSLLTTEQDFLEAVSESDGEALPCVRSYENDLSRLTLVGAVDFEQALTAAAADGGEAAAEHVDAGIPAMVVETVFPGPSQERSTVSTRLFLPARKVKEKAKKLRRSLDEDLLSSTTSRNILAMTFRQVVLQQLWNFELLLFRPGTIRNMEDLESPREVAASFSLSSSDKQVLSLLAEVVCISALESTKRNFHESSSGSTSINFSRWFSRPRKISSKDSSFILYQLFEDERGGDIRALLDNFKSVKEKYRLVETKRKYSWWILSAFSKLEKIGGPEFSNWAYEYLPAYRLQLDAGRLKNIKFEGWKKSADNRWEVLLTHTQMVELANILDMYYEDQYTLPDEVFSCGVDANLTNISQSKKSSSMFNMLSIICASGVFLVAINITGCLCLPHLHMGRKSYREPKLVPSSEVDWSQLKFLQSSEMEVYCISIVRKIKESFGWSGDIKSDVNIGAWIGEPPVYLMRMSRAEDSLAAQEYTHAHLGTSAQDIASYQVVLSADGRLVGFQPTSRVAVNHWAANPLAMELYNGRELSPGLVEPGLKIPNPKDVVVMELLMSINPDSRFALARPAQ